MTDSKFSASIHTLVLISEADEPMSSEQIAKSVGTNASYIRRLTGRLRDGGLIESHQGKSGFFLTGSPEQISLLMIYKAVNDADGFKAFEIHRNPNDKCIVGRHIKPVLSAMFKDIEEEIDSLLSGITLSDCIAKLREDARDELEVEQNESCNT